jgi:transcriptional regulator with XRE-family HTH domain
MTGRGERYTAIRKKAGLNQSEFAESLGISQGYSSQIETEAREAGREVLEKLASTYHVNINWFLYGTDTSEPIDGSDDFNVYIPLIQQEVAAGRGMEVVDFPDVSRVAVPRPLIVGHKPEHLRAVIVRGDSQKDREIFDRDIVVYDTQDVAPENLSVVSLAGQLVIKYVAIDHLKGTLSLLSANEEFPPRLIKGSELENVKIEGKVILNMHRM